MKALMLILAAIVAAGPAYAETLRVLRCDFHTRIDEEGIAEEKFTLVFEVRVDGSGIMKGNIGDVDVGIYFGDNAVTFMQPLDSGAIQTTTVLDGGGKAVHSRHTIFLGEMINAQHIGKCR